MALIECPECGREVSSSAAACPACAYPVATGSAAPDDTSQRRMWRERAKLAAQVAARSLVGVMLIGFGVDGTPQDASTAAVIGGILVAASSIPVWYRARAARLGKGLDTPRLEERVASMEQRHREQMAELVRMQAEQVADLEERVDFAERLLTKRRGQTPP